MLYGYSLGGYCVLLAALTGKDWDAILIAFIWFRSYHLRELKMPVAGR
ncbi:MAG: hypothetical protein WKF37_14255 [Bryobacteraceae bacterium]